MAYETPLTIAEVMKDISANKYLRLPIPKIGFAP